MVLNYFIVIKSAIKIRNNIIQISWLEDFDMIEASNDKDERDHLSFCRLEMTA